MRPIPPGGTRPLSSEQRSSSPAAASDVLRAGDSSRSVSGETAGEWFLPPLSRRVMIQDVRNKGEALMPSVFWFRCIRGVVRRKL